MKPTHTPKLISLLLALAMAFSLACPAFAAELDTTGTDEDDLTISTTSEDEDWDTLPVSDSSEEEAAEEESADSSAEEAPVEEEAEEAEEVEEVEEVEETEEAESAEEESNAAEAETDDADTSAETETVAEAEAETAAEVETEEDVAVTGQATTEVTDDDDDDDNAAAEGWNQDDNGDWTFYYYASSSDSAVTQAKDVVLSVPADSTVDSTTFSAGYYYFDEDGLLVADGTASVGAAVILDSSYVCDSTASDAGKIYQVTTTSTAANSQTTVSSTASYYTGSYGGLWYYKGKKFTGYIRTSSSGYVWVIKSGKSSGKLTGKMSKSTAYVRMDTGKKTTGDGLWYYNGKKYTGYLRRSSSDVYWVVTNGKGGTKLTGVMSTSKYYLRSDTGKRGKGNGKYYKNGKLYTGYVSSNRTYYKKGVKYTSLSGWKTISGKEYYFTKGVAAKGTKRIKRNGYTYTYTFRSDGSLVTDLFAYNSSYKKKKLRIVLARGSHTGTILAYNSSTKKYDIPVKSFVISMSKKSSNTKAGTYRLTSRKRWWKYSTGLWYQYATYVSGSGSWTHSEQYSTSSVKALKYKSYNGLGTNQSKQCIRMQVVNCKLIYDLASTNNSNTRVVITKGNGYLPFGKMTLSNNYDATGKVKSSQKYDPTDPAV
ncbi:MAG: hypothetical protein LUG64_00840 [Clostridiales bacterium]|nr:hypothetical protein [Clostridiales bacterium]